MNSKQRASIGYIWLVVLIALIINAQNARNAAYDALQLCISSVIPSLFPFIFLSLFVTSNLYGVSIRMLKPLAKLCKVPAGSESILLMAFIGGYPVGAQAIHTAWCDGELDKKNAERLLGFCNNAGPSFIFGILGYMFSCKSTVWALWSIHILSALLVGMLIPVQSNTYSVLQSAKSVSPTEALKRSLNIMSGICGWLVIFRIALYYVSTYILTGFSVEIQTTVSGMIELTNGCMLLKDIKNEAARFTAASFMLAFGGVCVHLQTRSVTGGLSLDCYLRGKILQSILSYILSVLAVPLLYPNTFSPQFLIALIVGIAFAIPAALLLKKSCSNLS